MSTEPRYCLPHTCQNIHSTGCHCQRQLEEALLDCFFGLLPSSELEVHGRHGDTFSFVDAVDFAMYCLVFCSAAFMLSLLLSELFVVPPSVFLLLLSFSFPNFLFFSFAFFLFQPSFSVVSLSLCLGISC